MCGGNIIYNEGDKVGTCESCGTKQTIPNISGEKIANMVDRANHFRLNNEYDKAQKIYEDILLENSDDAEIYWDLLLCKYGIEYVEDPKTKKRVPTINRLQYKSILLEDDYKKAITLADSSQKQLFEEEAKYIDEVQKNILDISKKEKPYDIFICYKESDANGRRTQDSVLAQEMYYGLTNEGYKVFFSRITLEDILGTAYEPYIFSALNSSKIMIVIATKTEYVNAVWVKNEWSRYLNLISNGENKILIPAYRDMDPYDLPAEFSHLQALDMGKLGFMQDLIRGINKIINKSENDKYTNNISHNTNVTANENSLMKRVEIFIEDGDFDSAKEYCEKLLDINPENGKVYYYLMLIEQKVKTIDEYKITFNDEYEISSNNYNKVIKYGDDNLKHTVNEQIKNNILKQLDEVKYFSQFKEQVFLLSRNKSLFAKEELNDLIKNKWINLLDKNKISFYDQKNIFYFLDENKNTFGNELYKELYDNFCESIYNKADSYLKKGELQLAFDYFSCIDSYKDAKQKASDIQREIENEKEAEKKKIEEERETERLRWEAEVKILAGIALLIVVVAIIFIVLHKNKSNKPINKAKTIVEYSRNTLIDNVDTVTFGSYPQSDTNGNKKEPIKWIVLEKDEINHKALLLSKYILDCQCYNENFGYVTWENCTLRRWLNNTFYNNAFSSIEQNKIQTTNVINNNNILYNINGGNETYDKLFLLSIDETLRYFGNGMNVAFINILGENVVTRGTNYAKSVNNNEGNLYVNDYGDQDDRNSVFFLRSPGINQSYAATVGDDGYLNTRGIMHGSSYGIRPAFWVSY